MLPSSCRSALHCPRRELAAALIVTLGLGNAVTALADGYLPVLVSRFVSGLPHGAYFGVASLLAASLVPPAQRGRAVSKVMLGLSVATVAGVPASTVLGQNLGWRAAYWLVLAISVLAAAMIMTYVPHQPANRGATIRAELSALRRSQVWFAMLAGVVGFGGMFAMYTFINPIVTDVTGLPESAVAAFLLVFGVGSVVGSWIAGPLADWSPVRSVLSGFTTLLVSLLLFWVASPHVVPAALMVFVVGALGSVLAITLQVRLMAAAGSAEMLGAALNHSALNVANGLGALLGSIAIDAGHGYRSTSLVGAALAAAGIVVFAAGLAWSRRRPTP